MGSLDALMESLAPAVVVVVVTNDPGPWFETTLQAIGDQDYPEFSVLVLDAASRDDPTARVAETLPLAFVRRLDANEGFAAAANSAISMVEGADFLVLAHDDVAPEPGALRFMVEEAFRSNAGVVGPKFLDWDRPERILHVGVSVDKSGAVVDRVESGEVDHGQHDAVRDVFSTPGGFTLVRRDLFGELGGFDTHLALMGEDLDLCWRAQVAGARVIVAPDAQVRHMELLASGRREVSCVAAPAGHHLPRARVEVSVQELERRAELHAAFKCHGPGRRLTVVPQMALLAVAEIVLFTLVGRPARAKMVASAWRWNVSVRSSIRRERSALQRIRRTPDREIRHLQIRGSARVNRYLRVAFTQGLRAANFGPDADPSQGSLVASRMSRKNRSSQPGIRGDSARVAAWAAVALVLLFATRSLLSGGVPVMGEFLRIPRPGLLMSAFANGQHVFGSADALPATPATFVLGVLGYVLLGSTGLLQTLLVVACLPVGAIGAARLCSRFAPWSPVVAGACYLAFPLPYDDIATGRLEALFAYAIVPWLMHGLVRAAELAPFGSEADAGVPSQLPSTPLKQLPPAVTPLKTFTRRVLLLGASVALLVAFDPPGAVTVLVLGAAVTVGILVTSGQDALRAASRVAVTTAVAFAIAVLLLAPWSFSVLASASPLDVLGGGGAAQAGGSDWSSLLRLVSGPLATSPLVWGLVGSALLPVLIGRRWRLAWAGRFLVCAIGTWLVALCCERGWLGAASVAPAQLLPIAGCALACSTALGTAAFRLDLPASQFGWRQAVSGLAAVAAVAGALPVLAASGGGRLDLPQNGWSEALSWMSSVPQAYRSGVAWLGDASVVPGRTWPLGSGLSYSIVEGGIPDTTSMWQASPSAASVRVANEVLLAGQGRTVELGRLLAADDVRYVVVTDALAPDVPGLQSPMRVATPASVTAGLASQTDLVKLPSQGGYEVFANPGFKAPAPASVRAPSANGVWIAAEGLLWVLVCACLLRWRRERSRGAGRKSIREVIEPVKEIALADATAMSGSDDEIDASDGSDERWAEWQGVRGHQPSSTGRTGGLHRSNRIARPSGDRVDG